MDNPFELASTPSAALSQFVWAYRFSQLVYVAAELRIAEQLKDGAKHFKELARVSRAHPESLYRVLRALASAGIFNQLEGGRFELNASAEGLLSDAPGSSHAGALLSGQLFYAAWGNLLHSVRTGKNAFEQTFGGMNLWEYCEQNPAVGQVFAATMSERVSSIAAAVIEAYDFARFSRIVDVGGGRGVLLATLLQANPSARGVLFDQTQVVQSAQEVLRAAGVLPRCEIVTGSFLDSVPGGGDVYILSAILHDWDDVKSAQILTNCRRAMQANRTLLIVERAIGSEKPTLKAALSDVGMMVVFGGRERTRAEYQSLLDGAGFELTNVIPTRLPEHIIEAKSVGAPS
jgi:hypothetical protein